MVVYLFLMLLCDLNSVLTLLMVVNVSRLILWDQLLNDSVLLIVTRSISFKSFKHSFKCLS